MFDKVVLAERLEDIIKSRKLTQDKIASETGLHQGRISRAVTNDNESIPGCDLVYGVCYYLGVSADYLLGLSKCQRPDPDLQAISLYTNLSDKALHNLHGDGSMFSVILKDRTANLLDLLLSREEGLELLRMISAYLTADHDNQVTIVKSGDGASNPLTPDVIDGAYRVAIADRLLDLKKKLASL